MPRTGNAGVGLVLRLALNEAETQEIVITRHGKPAGVLIGFEWEDDWLESRLEHDPRFLQRVEQARSNLRAGRGVKLEDIDTDWLTPLADLTPGSAMIASYACFARRSSKIS